MSGSVWNPVGWINTAFANFINFLQAGVGAVVRTVEDKLREQVSVKDFGAIGDGVVDDTAAFVASIAHLSGVGGILYVPAGIYKITSTLDIASNVTVKGVARFKSVLNFIGCTGLRSLSGNQHVSISNLYILGDNTLNTYGIELENNPRGVTLKNVFVRRFGTAGNGWGLYVHNATTFDMWCPHFEAVIVEDCGQGMNFVNVNAATLLNCISRLNQGHSLVASGCVTFNVIGGTYENPVGAGLPQYNIHILNTGNFNLIGPWAENARTNNLRIESSKGGVISGSLFDNVSNGGPGTYNNYITSSNNIKFIGSRIISVDVGETGLFVDNLSSDIDASGLSYETVSGTEIVDNSKATALTLTNGFSIPGGTQTVTKDVYMISSAGAVASDATSALLDGKDGFTTKLINVGINAITIKNNANTKLLGGVDCTLGQDDSLVLTFSAARSLWVEVGRTNL